eukprot:2577146-Amphidinium_carterae.1
MPQDMRVVLPKMCETSHSVPNLIGRCPPTFLKKRILLAGAASNALLCKHQNANACWQMKHVSWMVPIRHADCCIRAPNSVQGAAGAGCRYDTCALAKIQQCNQARLAMNANRAKATAV